MGIPSDDVAVTVTLSDGRIAVLCHPDDARVVARRADLFALQAGLGRGGRFDALEMAKLRCVCSIVTIDGATLPWPPCPPQRAKVRAYLNHNHFSIADYDALAVGYSRLFPGGTIPPVLTAGRR